MTYPAPPSGDVLVRLRTSRSSRTVYCVHPLHGTVVCYGPLAVSLGDGVNVCAFQSRGLLGTGAQAEDIEDMATEYVGRLLQSEPSGPYYLAGWSLGAYLALEMGKQLVARGHEVAQIFSIDNPLTGEGESRGDTARPMLQMLFQAAMEESIHEAFVATPESERIGFLVDACYARGVYSQGIERTFATRLISVFYRNYLAACRYFERFVASQALPLVHFRASIPSPFHGDAAAARAQTCARAGASCGHVIDGATHFNILTPQYARQIARHMSPMLSDQSIKEAT